MTVELQRANSQWIYRISPSDNCLVERRLNQAGAQWEEVQRYQYPRRASSELLRLSQGGRVREPKPAKQLPAKQKPTQEKPPSSPPASLLAEYKALRYDYDLVNERHRQTVQDAAVDIRRKQRRALEDMLAIGRRLIEVRGYFPHGEFERWVKIEFEISLGSASEYRNMALRFEGKPSIIEGLTPTTARLLAAPSVPDDVIDAVAKATIEAGKPLLVKEVKALKRQFMPPAAPKPKQLPPPEPDSPTTIEAEYTVTEPEPTMPAGPESEPFNFERWLLDAPETPTIGQVLAVLALAKRYAQGARTQEPRLYNAVTNALPTLSQLISAVEKLLK